MYTTNATGMIQRQIAAMPRSASDYMQERKDDIVERGERTIDLIERSDEFVHSSMGGRQRLSNGAAGVGPSLGEAREKVLQALKFFTSSENHGDTIGIDDGKNIRPFGYGDHGDTISESDFALFRFRDERNGIHIAGKEDEIESVTTQELSAKIRAFGGADAHRATAMLGLEGQAGYEWRKELPGENDQSVEEWFVGARGRGFGEAGLLGVTVGTEAMLGVESYCEVNGNHGPFPYDQDRIRWQMNAGVKGAAKAHAGITGESAMARAEAGARFRTQIDAHRNLVGDLYGFTYVGFNGFAGAEASARESIGLTGFSAEAGAFAGLKLGFTEGIGIAYKDMDVASLSLTEEGWVGVGAKASVTAGYDADSNELGVNADAGAALGVGGRIGVGVTIGGSDFGKELTSSDS